MARTAVITGGSDGIGYAIADRFAAHGADVVLVARDEKKLGRAATELRRHGHLVDVVSADLAHPEVLPDVLGSILRSTDRLDVLVNNAGIARFANLSETTDSAIEAMFHLNVTVPLMLTRGLLGALGTSKGSVVNISSYWATKMVVGRPSAAYSASRSAIEGMTKALASELGAQSIRVNAIAPGAVHTGTYQRSYLDAMSAHERTQHDEYVRAAYPLERIGSPQDVAAAADFLCSADASWITGTVLAVDGGLTTR
jgi:NAD(P)-dependent dehydrogenase (short-subunit alcohol dehydrogenase family)